MGNDIYRKNRHRWFQLDSGDYLSNRLNVASLPSHWSFWFDSDSQFSVDQSRHWSSENCRKARVTKPPCSERQIPGGPGAFSSRIRRSGLIVWYCLSLTFSDSSVLWKKFHLCKIKSELIWDTNILKSEQLTGQSRDSFIRNWSLTEI